MVMRASLDRDVTVPCVLYAAMVALVDAIGPHARRPLGDYTG